MKKLVFFYLTLFLNIAVFGQEICDNAIDDDGDGLIDLNDPECDCGDFLDGDIPSLIPNPDFEETDCCPYSHSLISCATAWQDVNQGTADYYNECDYLPPMGYPFSGIDNETGFVGAAIHDGGLIEVLGTNSLLSPLVAGVTYVLSLSVARTNFSENLNLTLYGTPNVGDMPYLGISCPIGVGDWEMLSTEYVVFEEDFTWQEVTIEFTPTVDMNAFAIGGLCDDSEPFGYFYFDNLVLLTEYDFYGIEKIGSWCTGDLIYIAEDGVGASTQWYKDGIALIGETNDTLMPIPYGLGTFSFVKTFGESCFGSTFMPIGPVNADFLVEDMCNPDSLLFENTSTYTGEDIIEWEWDMGGGINYETEDVYHTYDAFGTYGVTLIARSLDSMCNDTVHHDINFYQRPDAIIDFDSEGSFLWYGYNVFCANHPIHFMDASAVGLPSEIVEWHWDFGGGETSDLENPTYLYEGLGEATLSLVVTTNYGCKDTTTLEFFTTTVNADFTVENDCVFEVLNFENESTTEFLSELDAYEWIYGDGETGFTEDGMHVYTEPGTYTVDLVAISETGCRDTMGKIIEVYPLPAPLIEFIVDGVSSESGGTGGCYTSEVQFNSLSLIDPPSEIIGWSWNFGDGTVSSDENPAHLYATEGLYTVELIVVSNYDCEATITIDILMTNGLAYLTGDTTICQNGTVELEASSSDGSLHSYEWSIPGSDNSASQTLEGLTEDYWVYVTAENVAGCISPMDSILITVLDPITLEISPFDTVCIGDLAVVEVLSAGGRGDYTYEWTANGIPLADNTALMNKNPLITTEYCVTVEDGCETTPVAICTQVYVPERPSLTSDTTEGCVPVAIVFTDLTGPDASLNASTWHINEEVLFGNPVTYLFEEAGTYNVKLNVLSPEGCVSSTEVTSYITIHPLPTPNLYITPNPTTYFNTVVKAVNISPNYTSSFSWSTPGATTTEAFSDSLIEIYYPELISNNYTVSLIETTEFGCVDSAQEILIINNDQIIYAPSAFTPDGDGLNQMWGIYIEGIDIYDFHLTLFNRWGEMIWESYNPDGLWDGTYGGTVVQDGVYVWVIQAKDKENDKVYEFKGFVTVLR